MAWVFWSSAALVAYVYFGYPIMLRVYCGLRNADCGLNPAINPQSAIRDPHYTISVVIAARNEAARLPARIDNLLSLDYPADKRQIVVVSDGSTDETLPVLEKYRGVVDVVAMPPGGKALALNAGAAAARHEILV